jgi:proteasome lid subunit RPN8/RPN11
MDTEVWGRARQEHREPETVVGWFHSHPGLGAFFSGTDRRTQAAFFRMDYAVGLVIDPRREERAWFMGPRAEPVSDCRVVTLHSAR